MIATIFGETTASKIENLGNSLHRSISINNPFLLKTRVVENVENTDERISQSNLKVAGLNVHIHKNHILKDINIEIPDKKITCIIGPSGCGKSTLLKTFNRLHDDTEGIKIEGEIWVDGQNIYDKKIEVTELRKKMGLLSQRPCPLPMSIYDNIAYGCRIHGVRRKKALDGIVQKQLKAVGLWEEVENRLHTPASKLSIGQQQRLCLARGLAVEPEFILADEATSALDPISSKNIEELFVKLKNDYAIIMVTHTLRQALRIADYVVFMYLGEVIEAGNANDVFTNPKEELTRKYLEGAFS
jgi:phosphate transport system ATP-binding protein